MRTCVDRMVTRNRTMSSIGVSVTRFGDLGKVCLVLVPTPLSLALLTVGQMEAHDYAKKAYQWAKALKLLDPSIKLVSCGGEFAVYDIYEDMLDVCLQQKPDTPTGIAWC